MKYIYIIILLFLVVGCSSEYPEKDRIEDAKHFMPPDAVNVKYLGNDWYSFELPNGDKFRMRNENYEHKIIPLSK